ncbi:MAG: hypothetical protein ABI758_05485 [Candidatus Woesebacteria bacterium]
MRKEVCKGNSPWKCSPAEAQAVCQLHRKGISVVGLKNPIAVLKELQKLEDEDDVTDDIFIRLRAVDRQLSGAVMKRGDTSEI